MIFTFFLLVTLVAHTTFAAADQPVPAGDAIDHVALRQLNLAKANDDFGLALLHQLELDEQQKRTFSKNVENILISPFSVSTVLSMVLAGTNTETHEQIFKTLRFNPTQFKSDPDVFAAYKNLFQSLKQFSVDDKKNELQIANSIAMQKNFKILQTFLNNVTDNFDAKVFAEDFTNQNHQSTIDINKWVADKTNGKIEKLFDSDLSANTVMVLLNAIFFKGTWKSRFEKEQTVSGQFSIDNARTIATPFMHIRGQFPIAHFEDGALLELPYANDALSMLIFLPNEDIVESETTQAHKTLSSQFGQLLEQGSLKLAERFASLRNMSVMVQLPKFKIESQFSLKQTLTTLGITNVFSSASADFSKLTEADQNLYLSDVVHKTVIDVNEEGSEAAAATGAVIEFRSLPLQFNANRPFLFFIRDKMHRLTLFSGIVNKP